MYRFTTSLGYLIAKVGVRTWELFSRELAPYGCTIPMYRVLAGLWEKGDQQLGELSTMTTIELSTLSRLVSSMKRKGLVSRVRVESDERSVRLNLTAKGRALCEELMALAARSEAAYMRSLGEDEVVALKRSLNTVFTNLGQLERESAEANSKSTVRRRTPLNRQPLRQLRNSHSS
jgi:MarR family transcriptional regulator, organic hydroperoxide resistance regulator